MKKRLRHTNKRNRYSLVFPILTIIGIGIVVVLSSFYEKSWTYNWNEIRQQIKDSVKVAEYRRISGYDIDFRGKRPKQFDRRNWIMKNATISELLKLTKYPNGTIKATAYEGLIKNTEFEDKLELTLKAIADTEYSIYLADLPMNIGEYIVAFVLRIDDQTPPFIGGKPDFGLTKKEEEIILAEYRKVPSLWRK